MIGGIDVLSRHVDNVQRETLPRGNLVTPARPGLTVLNAMQNDAHCLVATYKLHFRYDSHMNTV